MNKILISSSAKGTIKESVELAKELKTGIEISRLPFYKAEDSKYKELTDDLKNNLKSFTNRITLHAMFSDINIGTQDILLRGIAQKRYFQSLEAGINIKADTILFHTGNKGTRHYGSQESFKKRYISFWREFIKEFEKNNIIAVVENVFEETPEYCLNLLEKIDSPNYKLALDAGHVNLYAQTNVEEWIKKYDKNLYHMHIHNNFKKNDDHSNLENGTLDYKKIFNTLKKQNISPSIVLEMFTEEDIRKSLEFIKLNYKD